MHKKILLVRVPEIQQVTDDTDYRSISVTKLMVPLGLPYLAAVIRDSGRHDVQLLDLYALDHEFYVHHSHRRSQIVEKAAKRLLDVVDDYRPDIVGFSALFTFQHDLVQKLAAIVRGHAPSTRIYVGGYATVAPELVLRDIPEADAVFLGESEDKILRVLDSETTSRPLEGINGIAYRRDGQVVVMPREFGIRNIDDIPWPAFDMLPLETYRAIQGRGEFPFLTSRSCPFSCSYCSSQLYGGRVWRRKSPERLLDEVGMMIDGYGMDFMWVVDEIFNVNKAHAKGFLRGMLDRGYNVQWWDNNAFNSDAMDKELVDLCKATNNVGIVISIESGSQRVLREIMNKRVNLDHAREMINYTTSVGIPVTVNFVIGSPGETKREIEETIEFASTLTADSFVFSLATPFPGTKYYDIAKANGMLVNGEEYILNMKYMEVSMHTGDFSSEWLKDTQYDANIRLNFFGSRLFKDDRKDLERARAKFANVYRLHTFHAVARLLEGYAEEQLGNLDGRDTVYATLGDLLSDAKIRDAYGRYFDWDHPAPNSYRAWLQARTVH